MFGRKKKNQQESEADASQERSSSDRTLTNEFQPTQAQIKRATRTRMIWGLITSLLLLISVIFVILVEVGQTSPGRLPNVYFVNIDLTNIIPLSVPNAVLINSIAQTLGLHDFYQVGLWGYCEGYNGQGITSCSTPQTLYWFNPVEIIKSELISGASIALPAEVTQILGLIKTVSQWMFGLYLAGACLTFVMIFIVPLSVYSRWATLPIMIFTFLAALCTAVASVIATVLFVIMQNAVTQVTQLNIGASIGVEMFVFMWIAAGCAVLAWLIQLGMCCCCASRRDVKKGKKRGSKKAWGTETNGVSEKPERKHGMFGRKKKVSEEA